MQRKIFTTPDGNIEVRLCRAGPHSDDYPTQDHGWEELPDGTRERVKFIRGAWMNEKSIASYAKSVPPRHPFGK